VNNCVEKVSVIPWSYLQRRYKTFYVCCYQPALCAHCVLVLYGLRVWFKLKTYFLLTSQGIISKEMFQDVRILYLSRSFVWNHFPSIFHIQYILLSVLLFYEFVSLPSSSPLWRSKTQNFGSTCSRTPYGSHKAVIVTRLDERGDKWKRCIRDIQKALTSPCFRKQVATLVTLCFVLRRVFYP